MKVHELRDTLLPWTLIVGLYAAIFGALVAIQHFGLVSFTRRVADMSDLWTTMPIVTLMLTMLLAMVSVFVWSNISNSARTDRLPELLRERMERTTLQGLAFRGRARYPVVEVTTPFAQVVGQLALSDASSLVVLDGEETRGLVNAQGIARTIFYSGLFSPDRKSDSNSFDGLLDFNAGDMAIQDSLVSVDSTTSLYDVVGLMMSRRLTELVMVEKVEGKTVTKGTVQLLDLVAELFLDLGEPPSSPSKNGQTGRKGKKDSHEHVEGPAIAGHGIGLGEDTAVLNGVNLGKERGRGLAPLLNKGKRPPNLETNRASS